MDDPLKKITLVRPVRRHDLDALRAFAMFLGIALHAALSFTGFLWIVQDTRTSYAFAIFVAAIHGFRMQLFMLVSGFFTMMIYRVRGLRVLLLQRAKRILVPCLIGLATFVPALDITILMALRNSSSPTGPNEIANESAIFTAVRNGDAAALQEALDAGADPNHLDDRFQIPILGWAALKGDAELARILMDAGASMDAQSTEGHRPVHQAAFLGHANVLDLLAARGADLTARSYGGDTPANTARANRTTTENFARILGLNVKPEDELIKGREECLKILEAYSALPNEVESLKHPDLFTRARLAYTEWLESDRFISKWKLHGIPVQLFRTDVFHHLWFLWFLCWLVGGFAILAILFRSFDRPAIPSRIFAGHRGFVMLVFLTMIPQAFMSASDSIPLGPDTSAGILPMPHLLVYYGIFFAFGAFLFDSGESAFVRFENGWWLPIGVFLALPLSLAKYDDPIASGLFMCLYTWSMAFGSLGLFRKRLSRENRTVRYLSDSSYWLYLAHPPLVVVGQLWISSWNLPSGVKFVGLFTIVNALLLISYQWFVRKTWIGLLLNGRRPT